MTPTKDEVEALCERLLAAAPSSRVFGDDVLLNPTGPDAAATLKRLVEENAELKETQAAIMQAAQLMIGYTLDKEEAAEARAIAAESKAEAMREAAIALRDDMLMRAEMNKHRNGGELVVEAGIGVWAKFNTTLSTHKGEG